MHQNRFVPLALAALFAAPLAAQAPAAVPAPDTGAVAPAFSAPGATKDGVLKSVALDQYRGKTVVLAFFYQARTKG
jgi:hypothetical protein